jgi:tetratricopeptide (TPR) repeat protein
MRSIRIANTISWVIAGVIAVLFGLRIYFWLVPSTTHLPGIRLYVSGKLALSIMVPVYAYSYLLLMHVGRFDPVIAWVIEAWRRADYESALFRLRLFSFCGNRAPFRALMLTAANRADQAYGIATTVTLAPTDMEEPSYNLDFAAGRAALALGDLVRAQRHFENLYQRFPGSALARYALGDVLLWERRDPARAHELLTSALADSFRKDLPHWKQLGLEAELHASHAWSLAATGQPGELQNEIDRAVQLAGRSRPVQAAVYLRLGHALAALNHVTSAKEHWRFAHEIDPDGWAGLRATRELSEFAISLHS